MMALEEAKKKRMEIIIWFVIIGLILMLVFSGVIFRSLQITRKQKQIIEEAKDEITRQKEELEKQKQLAEEKNKEIADSIYMREEYRMRYDRMRIKGRNYYRRALFCICQRIS